MTLRGLHLGSSVRRLFRAASLVQRCRGDATRPISRREPKARCVDALQGGRIPPVTWRGVIWREAGNYGRAGTFEARKNLGEHTFAEPPTVGQIVELQDQEWLIVSVSLGFLTVTPRIIRPTS